MPIEMETNYKHFAEKKNCELVVVRMLRILKTITLEPLNDTQKSVSSSEIEEFSLENRSFQGIGRRLLERAGWQDGQGLGSSTIGISEPVTTDGAKTSVKDKTGLGYHGEKVDRNPKKLPSQSSSQIRITTVYDDPDETDPTEPTNRRSEPTANKNRPRTKNLFHKA